MATVEVEFVRHIAKGFHPDFGYVDVDLKQLIVYVIGPESGRKIEVGYVCTHPGAPFNAIVEKNVLPEFAWQEVEKQINERLPGQHRFYYLASLSKLTPEPQEEPSRLVLPDSYYEDGDEP